MRTFAVRCDAPPAVAWRLLAEPRRWHGWSPHVFGAWGLGDPVVTRGRRGIVRLFGAVPVPVRIVAVTPGRMWRWRVGLVTMDHRVDPEPGADGRACVVAIDLRAPGPLEATVAAAYGPVITFCLRRLVRLAESSDDAEGAIGSPS